MNLDEFFAFKIGQFVIFKGHQVMATADVRFAQILARELEECHGGVQIHYTLTGLSLYGEVRAFPNRFHEFQLREITPEEMVLLNLDEL